MHTSRREYFPAFSCGTYSNHSRLGIDNGFKGLIPGTLLFTANSIHNINLIYKSKDQHGNNSSTQVSVHMSLIYPMSAISVTILAASVLGNTTGFFVRLYTISFISWVYPMQSRTTRSLSVSVSFSATSLTSSNLP